MSRKQKGKNIRVPEQVIPLLAALRAKMKRTTTVGGMMVNPAVNLGDGLVVGWSLALADYLMNPNFAVIHRHDFAAKLDVQLALVDLENCSPDQRRARIGLLVAAASESAGYNTSETLRAAVVDEKAN